jgi:hypothetical protein
MIDPEAFNRAWAAICTRFGREVDDDQAGMYFDYLDDQMSTAAFLQAARGVWATARYFPRPADFLLIGASGEWALVLTAAAGFCGPEWKWVESWKRMSPRCQEACKSLGGMDAIRALMEKDLIKLKLEWERAYEQATTELALALPMPEPKLLAR